MPNAASRAARARWMAGDLETQRRFVVLHAPARAVPPCGFNRATGGRSAWNVSRWTPTWPMWTTLSS